MVTAANNAALFSIEPRAVETLDRPLAIVVQRTPNKIDVKMAGVLFDFSLGTFVYMAQLFWKLLLAGCHRRLLLCSRPVLVYLLRPWLPYMQKRDRTWSFW